MNSIGQLIPSTYIYIHNRTTANSKETIKLKYFIDLFPLYLEDEGGRSWRKKADYKEKGTIWPISLKSHCQHICLTVQFRNDCATVGNFLFIYLTDIIIISIIYVAPCSWRLEGKCERFEKNAKIFSAWPALGDISGGILHCQIFISGINCSRVSFSL